MKILTLPIFLVLALFPANLEAAGAAQNLNSLGGQYEIFDGQMYNGKYYPRVDGPIEWPPEGEKHIELHIFSQEKIDVSMKVVERNNQPILCIQWDLKFRGERLCRSSLAPGNFKKGMKLYTYQSSRVPDYNNIFFLASDNQPEKVAQRYNMPAYVGCTAGESVSDVPPECMADGKAPPATPEAKPTAPAAAPAKNAGDESRKVSSEKNIGVDYNNNAVPFSF